MTQIVSVSANTAALNIETLRQPRRLSVKDHVRDLQQIIDKNTRRADNLGDLQTSAPVVASASLGLGLFTAGQQPQQHVPLYEVEAAYREVEE